VAARDRHWDRIVAAIGMRRRWRPGQCITEYDPLSQW
jgi:hypothetical protein